jgi:hypothetical protein
MKQSIRSLTERLERVRDENEDLRSENYKLERIVVNKLVFCLDTSISLCLKNRNTT